MRLRDANIPEQRTAGIPDPSRWRQAIRLACDVGSGYASHGSAGLTELRFGSRHRSAPTSSAKPQLLNPIGFVVCALRASVQTAAADFVRHLRAQHLSTVVSNDAEIIRVLKPVACLIAKRPIRTREAPSTPDGRCSRQA